MTYIEAPTYWAGPGPAVFLAGGITDCPNWQATAIKLLDQWIVLNPRRAEFPIDDPFAARTQILWEYDQLQRAAVILFWFPACDSPQPIALYELGRHAALNRLMAVGVEPGYPRETDVRIQLELARPEVTVYDTLTATCARANDLLAIA